MATWPAGGQRVIYLVCPSAQGPEDPTSRLVELDGQQVSLPLGEHLGQGVLKERETSGLALNVAKDMVDQTRFELDTHPLGRPGDRLCQALLRGDAHSDDSRPHRFCEGRILEGSVEEVSSHGQDQPNPRAIVGDHRGQGIEKQAASSLGGHRREHAPRTGR